MNKLIPTLLALTSVICPALAQQEVADSLSSSKIYLVRTSKDTSVYEILRQGRDVNFRDAIVPHFAIRTSNNKFILTIGGAIQPIIGYDIGNSVYKENGAGCAFVTNAIPVPAERFKRSSFFLNALNAWVDLQVVGFGGTANQLTGYLKIGTDGVSSNIRLKKAYIVYRGFSTGMQSSLFTDGLANQPPTIDTQGPCGSVTATTYGIDYTSPSFHGLRAAIGIEVPTFNSSMGRYLGKDYKTWNNKSIDGEVVCDPSAYNQLVPDIPMWIEWAKSDVNRIRLSGIIRTLNYRDLLAQKRRTTVGWGLMLSGNYSPVKQLVFYLQAAYGKGIGNYINDLAGIPLSYTPKDQLPGELTPTPEMGLMGGISYNATKRLQFNAMYSIARMWNVGNYALESEASDNPEHFNNYRYANYVAANAFYNFSSFLQVGLEYLWGQRKTYGAGSAIDNRIQAQISFIL